MNWQSSMSMSERSIPARLALTSTIVSSLVPRICVERMSAPSRTHCFIFAPVKTAPSTPVSTIWVRSMFASENTAIAS